MLRGFCWSALALLLVSCAHGGSKPIAPGAPAPAPSPSRACPALPSSSQLASEQLIQEYGSNVDAYQLEGGVWLKQLPLLINEDFDFAVAMAMEGIGAGIAAAKRKSNNEAKAASLQGVSPSALALEKVDLLRAQGSHAYFILWGKEQAVLRLVVDADASCRKPTKPAIGESPARPFEGEHGWLTPGVLDQEANRMLDSL